MNIFIHELKSYKKTTIIWILSIIFLLFVTTSFYPIFSKDMSDFFEIINNLPDIMKTMLNMNADTMGSILGYYSFILMFIFICAGIQSMVLGMSILSKEVRESTADFLLSKPVSRLKIVVSKISSGLTLLVLSNIIYFIVFYLILLIHSNNINYNTYLLLTSSIFFISLIFYSLGLLISTIIKTKNVVSISLGVVFGFYILGTFMEDKIRILMPFKYFNLSDILINNTYELKYVFVSLFIFIISSILVYVIYKNKDIQPV
jgi:ABC-2 type transport system permease protein